VQARLLPSLFGASYLFGHAVTMSADGLLVAVGSPGYLTNRGRVFVFRCTSTETGTWAQEAALAGRDVNHDWFGLSVSLSADGSSLAVGAHASDYRTTDAGLAHVFRRLSPGAWGPATFVYARDLAASDLFGFSLALSGNGLVLAVGAYADDGRGSDAGTAYVFSRPSASSDVWTELAELLSPDSLGGDNAGYSVAVDYAGTTVALGAPWSDTFLVDAGTVHVYTRANAAGTLWTRQRADARLDGDLQHRERSMGFGLSVSLSADGLRVAVGAYHETGETGFGNQGSVWVFDRVSTSADALWTQRVRLAASAASAGDELGFAVALGRDGKTVFVSARLAERVPSGGGAALADSGAAYSFDLDLLPALTVSAPAADPCASNPCYPTVPCVAAVPPDTGFVCGLCPEGLEGDGVTCAAPPGASLCTGGQLQKVVSDNPRPSDWFGYALASSSNARVLVAGSYLSDDGAVDNYGNAQLGLRLNGQR
jgi:hypothetical protein